MWKHLGWDNISKQVGEGGRNEETEKKRGRRWVVELFELTTQKGHPYTQGKISLNTFVNLRFIDQRATRETSRWSLKL